MTFAWDWLRDTTVAIPDTAWVAVAAVLLAQRLVARLGMWPYAVAALPGTLAHEFAHYLVAQLLLARPRFPELWPTRTPEGGWRLGAVMFVPAWWRTAPIALAPLALLPLGLAWMAAWLAPAEGIAFALHAWIAGSLLNASLPSRADLRLAGPALLVVTVAGALAWALMRV